MDVTFRHDAQLKLSAAEQHKDAQSIYTENQTQTLLQHYTEVL